MAERYQALFPNTEEFCEMTREEAISSWLMLFHTLGNGIADLQKCGPNTLHEGRKGEGLAAERILGMTVPTALADEIQTRLNAGFSPPAPHETVAKAKITHDVAVLPAEGDPHAKIVVLRVRAFLAHKDLGD